MVIDLKYHLASIIAIFLALAIGILIGTAMVGEDGVANGQKTLIGEIEENLKNLRTQNSQFRTKLTALEQTVNMQDRFIDQLFQDAISEKLSGTSCLIVQDKKRSDLTELLEVMKAAGVTVTDFAALPVNWKPEGSIPEWDFCLLMSKSLPTALNNIFSKERVYHPSQKELASKESLYQLFKSLANKLNLEKAKMEELIDSTPLSEGVDSHNKGLLRIGNNVMSTNTSE